LLFCFAFPHNSEQSKSDNITTAKVATPILIHLSANILMLTMNASLSPFRKEYAKSKDDSIQKPSQDESSIESNDLKADRNCNADDDNIDDDVALTFPQRVSCTVYSM
jgi:hypothetical protein